MIRLTSKKLWSFIAAGLLAFVVTPAQAADRPAPKAEEKARGLVERNQKVIAAFAHPTSRFREMKHVRTEKIAGGFKVVYEMNYTAFRGYGCKFYSNLAFTFDDAGYYMTVETAGRNGTVAPFAATDTAISAIQAVIRSEPELRENYEIVKMFEKSDARDILKFVLALSR
ncbi:MAG: hypothetical protein C0467_23020 [Planctomycetaceae bacterium]|nr:hypothetical protein [Planctomycetaceae bacterium]